MYFEGTFPVWKVELVVSFGVSDRRGLRVDFYEKTPTRPFLPFLERYRFLFEDIEQKLKGEHYLITCGERLLMFS